MFWLLEWQCSEDDWRNSCHFLRGRVGHESNFHGFESESRIIVELVCLMRLGLLKSFLLFRARLRDFRSWFWIWIWITNYVSLSNFGLGIWIKNQCLKSEFKSDSNQPVALVDSNPTNRNHKSSLSSIEPIWMIAWIWPGFPNSNHKNKSIRGRRNSNYEQL